jgi:uncharacterized Zn finger protein
MPQVREEFIKMQFDVGCPECGSDATFESVASIHPRNNVAVSICDECGHVEEKFEVPA